MPSRIAPTPDAEELALEEALAEMRGRSVRTTTIYPPESSRIDALEREVAALRAELAALRAETIGAKFAHASDYEHRPALYQAGVE
jgi:hypothetical protein